jgi:cobalt-zinc-cadmium resistance protein CzcA
MQRRSITRSGLSVVTAVFEEGTDIYRARQLVNERLVEARQRIPEGAGVPEMAPVSTGLGEIYQFEVRSKGKSLMALRETLDWMIAPRLRTIEGVVEVNSFGGHLRTYQVTLDPERMGRHRVTASHILEAIRASNLNEGGGVLEVNEESLVVRGEGRLRSTSDIESVVLRTESDGSVLTVHSVATVEYKPMIRYGAVTRDGTREAVTGIVMMLQGANSRDVAARVHTAVLDIEKSLPGIQIDTFYDRKQLVDRTIDTVSENLLYGGGLVVLVLLLLMGSIRAGVLVALSIPLSFIGAVVGMRILGLSGNLMSLGALDFGIIIDGSVVMVEYIVASLAGLVLTNEERRSAVRQAALEMARPTVFAVLIIGIVYLPILSLRGIEGKMFAPMAWTFLFALFTALVCALTLTPVLASLIFRKVPAKRSLFFRMCLWVYEGVLKRIMNFPLIVAACVVAIVAVSVMTLTQLGAVFLPKLDEGDLALQIARQPQVGLAESLRQAQIAETLLLEKFPEVRAVVSKTGRPEIATDPMGIDFSGVFVLLHPRAEWTTGRTKEDLAKDIKAHLGVHLPGVSVSLSQPIELRVNELLEGVRADVGVSIFGDDLTDLNETAEQVEAVLNTVPGAGDVEMSQVAGLPQLRVRLDRKALAQHGIAATDVLTTVATMGGLHVGDVYEGERRFEIRLRLAPDWRSEPGRLRRLRLVSANGQTVPLEEVADISTTYGPAAISRENGRRRMVVQVNVRGRDLVSFVDEAKEAVAERVALPEGSYIDWGGQFKNFEEAANRLMFAIPVALLLIFVLLHTTFRSASRALFIYLAIPMAASGGVFALWLRGYPLSISAAVGFIALFGIAVMNGVVLMTTIQFRESQGDSRFAASAAAAKARLRAVLMTAFTDIVGFVPMALSVGDGAEVQRPLATVVIGGLVTATILTLLVLPVLYGWGAKKESSNSIPVTTEE